MRNVELEHRSLRVTDGQGIHHTVGCGIAAGVPPPASGAHFRPATAMHESVPRCKFLHHWLIKRSYIMFVAA